ncbi:MAG: peptidase MA family metallohydrolase [Candidatus Saccharibacteria bacterium]
MLVKLVSGLTIAFLVVLTVSLVRSPRQAIFGISRYLSRENTSIRTKNLSEVRTPHFIIKYHEENSKSIPIIAANVEDIYGPVTKIFGTEPQQKTLIVVYPDSESLAKSFGWDKNEQAMGVYWGGTIRVLDPHVWINAGDIGDEFAKQGPMAHEFTHLMVDYYTKGNYPRWFTEGVAQYVERIVTGFEFSPPFSYNSQSVTYYDFTVMENGFDTLDQRIVYWESLRAVQYITDKFGEKTLFSIMTDLGQGYDMPAAFEKATGVKFVDFAQDFYTFLDRNPQ